MKKIGSILLVVLLLAVTVSAQNPFVMDGSNLLAKTEADTLEKNFGLYYAQYGFTIAVVTVDSLDGETAAEYAAEHYSVSGYGNDGILLLICENEGQWYIYTSGICASVISDAEAAQIGAAMIDELQSGKYYDACRRFALMSAEPVCEVVDANAAAAEQVQSGMTKYVFYGLGGGLLVGILVAVLLAFKAKAPRRPSRAARKPEEYPIDN